MKGVKRAEIKNLLKIVRAVLFSGLLVSLTLQDPTPSFAFSSNKLAKALAPVFPRLR